MSTFQHALPRGRTGGLAALGLVLLAATACGGGDPEEPGTESTGTFVDGTPVPPASEGAEPVPAVEQPPLPADPSGYTPEYVQETLTALFQDYQAALVTYQSAGSIDDSVRIALAQVYDPTVLDQQVRNLEDYFPGGENLEEPPGAVVVEVTGLHSVSADCILAITTYDADAVTTLDAPAEEDFFIGLARNAADADGTRPWLITAEYSTSDGEPLPEDVCA